MCYRAFGFVGLMAIAVGGIVAPTFADPASPYFSEPMYDQELAKQQGPWAHSSINLPAMTGNATDASSALDLGSVVAGAAAGGGAIDSANGAVMSALAGQQSAFSSAVNGAVATGGGGGGGTGAALGATGAVFSALGVSH